MFDRLILRHNIEFDTQLLPNNDHIFLGAGAGWGGYVALRYELLHKSSFCVCPPNFKPKGSQRAP